MIHHRIEACRTHLCDSITGLVYHWLVLDSQKKDHLHSSAVTWLECEADLRSRCVNLLLCLSDEETPTDLQGLRAELMRLGVYIPQLHEGSPPFCDLMTRPCRY